MALTYCRQKHYNRDEIRHKITESLERLFGNLEDYFKPYQSFLLKPNFVIVEKPEKGATTHPEFYMAVAELLQNLGKNVAIGDSPGFGSIESALKTHGTFQECLDKNIQIISFKKQMVYNGIEKSNHYKSLTVAAEIFNFDAVINLPKLKVHQQFYFTGATKNLYGCVIGKKKAWRHVLCKNNPITFAEMIIANANKIKPLLNIADGIHAMHCKGPMGGEIYPLNRIILSDSFLECDWLFCSMVGLQHSQAPLFNALDSHDIEQLKQAYEKCINLEPFEVAKHFKPSYVVPISFSPQHMIKSIFKTLMYSLKTKKEKS